MSNCKRRTIIMLAGSRSGTSALYEVFRKHRDVGNGIRKSEDPFFEPRFWRSASYALNGKDELFRKQVQKKFPYIKIPKKIDKKSIFKIWNTILDEDGPVIFDKTPFYLGDRKTVDLIMDYAKRGNDVTIFFLIRNPLDVITSQHELRRFRLRGYSLREREIVHIERLMHIDEICEKYENFPIFKYEDIAKFPNIYIPKILRYCQLDPNEKCWSHIRPVSIGRYWASINRDIRKWKISREIYALPNRWIEYKNINKKPPKRGYGNCENV